MTEESTTRAAGANDNIYLSDVLLLCVTCQRPIKARINTPQWIRVEWISPDGECQACHNQTKEQSNGKQTITTPSPDTKASRFTR